MADIQNKGGRPTAEALRQRKIEVILDRHADGEALETICASLDPPLPTRIWRSWVRADQTLREAWELSDRDFVHALFDRYAAVTEELRSFNPEGGGDIRTATARVNALKAAQDGYKNICARLNPGKYAEQKDKQGGVTLIINTPLPLDENSAAITAVEGDYEIIVDPKRLTHETR
jgi:hypothetical protein